MEIPKRANGDDQKGEPIPNNKPNNKHIYIFYYVMWK